MFQKLSRAQGFALSFRNTTFVLITKLESSQQQSKDWETSFEIHQGISVNLLVNLRDVSEAIPRPGLCFKLQKQMSWLFELRKETTN